jgi:hypothetical protein
VPALRITKNDVHLCTVGSDDVWMFSANVRADIWGPARSELTVTGGSKRRPDGSSDFLVWEMAHALREGDRVVFLFEEGSASSPAGSVPDDETSSEEEDDDDDLSAAGEEILGLAARPQMNLDCRWRFFAPGEQEMPVAPDDDRQNVHLHILWNEMRPHRVRASLSQTSLAEIASRSGGKEIFLRYFEHGMRIELAIGA